jgi:hypothetical protein
MSLISDESARFPGWRKLIDPLVERCEQEGAKILQIKEKFGGLRFYADGCSMDLLKDINLAEKESFKVCQDCGKPGKSVSIGGWNLTLCEGCEGKLE